MLNDLVTLRRDTKTRGTGTAKFKVRTYNITTRQEPDEEAARSPRIAVKEFFTPATEEGHSAVTVHAEGAGDVRLYLLADTTARVVSVGNTSLFLSIDQFDQLRVLLDRIE